MIKNVLKFCMIFILTSSSYANYRSARIHYEKNKMRKPETLLVKLVDAKLYYSAIPVLKNLLVKGVGRFSNSTERAISKLIEEVGVKQFEVLPIRFLSRTSSGNLKFIVAKKYFGQEKLAAALSVLKTISRRHSIYPYARNMEGTIYSVQKQYEKAYQAFFDCQRSSNQNISGAKGNRKNQLKMNRDYCIVGKARVRYAQRRFDDADLLYLDLPKSSIVWPEILFDEAWNSYYQKNYNRALGKLVSYKAPVFSYFFNPEIDVLNALSYMKLCLYGDVKKTVEDFNKNYFNQTKYFRRVINKLGKRYKLYFNLISKYQRYGKAPNRLIGSLLNNVLKEHAFIDLNYQFNHSKREIERIRSNKRGSFNSFIYRNALESHRTYKKIIGGYVRSRLVANYAQLYKAFEGMSYIKLEVLAQRKAKLYSFDENDRSRGDLKYIERNEKQYFWDFNGEFWADELGDYVFALKSEC